MPVRTAVSLSPNVVRGGNGPAYALLCGLGAAGGALYLAAYRLSGQPFAIGPFLGLFATMGVLYLLACWLVLRAPDRLPYRQALLTIAAFGLLYRMFFFPIAPTLSDDFYRYVWDGFIQGRGYSPYRYPPQAAELAPLRDTAYWPKINRKAQTSAYPPVAELAFRGLALVRPMDTGVFKLAFLLLDGATCVLLARLLRLREQSPLGVIVYAWHPLPIFEFFHSAHIDVLAVTLIVLALYLQARGRQGAAGIALGLATLTKLYPILLLPAFARRGQWTLPLAAGATVVVGFLPALLSGDSNFRQFPTYLAEEGYDNGERYIPLRLLRLLVPIPNTAYVGAVALVLLLLALRLYLAPEASGTFDVPRRALLLVSAVLLLVTPAYPWYYIWMIPLLTLVPIPGLFLLPFAAAGVYYTLHLLPQPAQISHGLSLWKRRRKS